MKVCCYSELTENGLLLHYSDASIKAEIAHLWEGVKAKYNGFMTVTLDKPYKSRTTGEGSQNNLIWLLIQKICNEIGEDPKEVERDLKERATAKGYPYHVSKLGKMIPESMTKINTVEMSYLIDTAFEVCAFLGIVLEPQLKIEAAQVEQQGQQFDIF